MSFCFPSFTDTKCISLRACGELATKDTALLKWIRRQKTLEARYRAAGRTRVVHLRMGGRAGNRVHIDAATPEFFRTRLPKAINKIDEVRQALKRLYGIQIDVSITGRYLLGLKDLPPLITSMIAETAVEGVSLRTVGGRFAVKGASIDAIDWWIWESRNDAVLDLEATATLEIDDHYLNRCLAVLDPAFKELIFKIAER